MKTQMYAVKLCMVQRSCAELSVEAESAGDAHVIAEKLAQGNGVLFCAADEELIVESVLPTNAEAITHRRQRRGAAMTSEARQ